MSASWSDAKQAVSTCWMADDAPFVRKMSSGRAGWPSRRSMNRATSPRNWAMPWEFV
jgi:hypothetical protein